MVGPLQESPVMHTSRRGIIDLFLARSNKFLAQNYWKSNTVIIEYFVTILQKSAPFKGPISKLVPLWGAGMEISHL
jgi:hypothetical protein